MLQQCMHEAAARCQYIIIIIIIIIVTLLYVIASLPLPKSGKTQLGSSK